jgi:hypothetical protein
MRHIPEYEYLSTPDGKVHRKQTMEQYASASVSTEYIADIVVRHLAILNEQTTSIT